MSAHGNLIGITWKARVTTSTYLLRLLCKSCWVRTTSLKLNLWICPSQNYGLHTIGGQLTPEQKGIHQSHQSHQAKKCSRHTAAALILSGIQTSWKFCLCYFKQSFDHEASACLLPLDPIHWAEWPALLTVEKTMDVAKIISNCLLLATSFCERHCGLSSAVMWCAKLLGQLWICRSKMMRSPKLPIQSKYIQIIHLVHLNPSFTLQETCPQHCLLPASLQDIWARLTTPRHVIQWWKRQFRQLQSFARSSLGLDLLELPGVQGLKWDKSWQHEVHLQGRKSFSMRLWGFTELFCHSSVQMEADVRQQL